MSNKLTKNDRLKSQSEKRDVMVAAFEALLGRNKLWEKYMKNFNLDRLHGHSTEIYTDWKAWASFTPPYQWCSSAFVWDHTTQGNDIWKDLDYEWLRWICQNLNK